MAEEKPVECPEGTDAEMWDENKETGKVERGRNVGQMQMYSFVQIGPCGYVVVYTRHEPTPPPLPPYPIPLVTNRL